MARKVVQTWQEALKLLEGSRVRGQPKLESPGVLLIALEMLNEEPRILRIASIPLLGLNGSLLEIKGMFTIDLLAPESEAEMRMGQP